MKFRVLISQKHKVNLIGHDTLFYSDTLEMNPNLVLEFLGKINFSLVLF